MLALKQINLEDTKLHCKHFLWTWKEKEQAHLYGAHGPSLASLLVLCCCKLGM